MLWPVAACAHITKYLSLGRLNKQGPRHLGTIKKKTRDLEHISASREKNISSNGSMDEGPRAQETLVRSSRGVIKG